MQDLIPIIIIAVLLLGMLLLTQRNRQRAAAAEARRREAIGVGTEVMTTSGLYGTVTAVNDDDTVRLSIAPGIEVRWALAALRDVASLPDRRRGAGTRATGPGARDRAQSPYSGPAERAADEPSEERPQR